MNALIAVLLAAPAAAYAVSDEIQVYDGAIAAPGIYNLTLHNNYTPDGIKSPEFPGGITADKSLNGTAEWAYGVNEWFEAGLYLPVYSIDKNLGEKFDGLKLRTLFVVPHAQERRFFYGVNFEFSYNATQWEPQRMTSEIRPIIGWHLSPVDIIINPIFDTSYNGVKNLEFEPSTRIAYHVSPTWGMAIEEYADLGPLHRFYSGNTQPHQLFGVADYSGKILNVEAGVGFGLTPASDDLILKLIISHDLN